MPTYIRVTPLTPPRPLNFTVFSGGMMISLSLPKAVPPSAPIPAAAATATHSQFFAFLIVFSGGDYCRILTEDANTFFGENNPSLVPKTPEAYKHDKQDFRIDWNPLRC